MITADSSVVIAAFASWHEGHEAAREAVLRADRAVAHVLIESFSVLTRLPPPNRAAPELVHRFMIHRFPDPPLALNGRAQRKLLDETLSLRIRGAALYDALIAATARGAGALLLTRDRKAASTYEAMAVDHEFVED